MGTAIKIISLSIKDLDMFHHCLIKGISAVTLKEEVFDKLIEDISLTLKCQEGFLMDWNHLDPSLLSNNQLDKELLV